MILSNQVRKGSKVLFICCNSRCCWKEAEDFAREVGCTRGEFEMKGLGLFVHLSEGFIRFLTEDNLFYARGIRFNIIQTCGNLRVTPEMIALYKEVECQANGIG